MGVNLRNWKIGVQVWRRFSTLGRIRPIARAIGFGGSMARLVVLCLSVWLWVGAGSAAAQSPVWIQIEAQPGLTAAETRVRSYASRLENIASFQISARWYVIAIGPFAPEVAEFELSRLRAQGAVPGDSYIVDGSAFGRQIWPVGAQGAPTNVITAAPLDSAGTGTELAAAPLPEPEPEPIPAEETLAQSRAAERQLTRDERRELQTALAWEDFYSSTVDGLFGPGTRRSMSAWQEANGFEVTGVLSTKQRATLLDGYREVLRSLGLRQMFDREAGIDIDLPTAAVEFGRYVAPFAQYDAKEDGGPRVLLISQSGDGDTLASLFEVMQTLEVIPPDGPRRLRRSSFTIEGENSRIASFTYAELADDAVKGFTLVWPAGDRKRRDLVLTRMRDTFSAVPGVVLPDSAGADVSEQRLDLLSGLQIRSPEMSRSGFFVDNEGAVLTTIEALGACDHVTIGDSFRATIVARDTGSGLALLRPDEPLAPIRIANLRASDPRLKSDVAVAGYSFEGILGAPTLTFGTIADLKGLSGDRSVNRLALGAEPGDAGGPVLDEAGRVLGMLLPRNGDQAKALPSDVSFAADAGTIAAFLSANGVPLEEPEPSETLNPADLVTVANDMTVLVSCWK